MPYSYRRMPGAFHVIDDATQRRVAEFNYRNDAEKNDAWQKTLRKVSELNGSVLPQQSALPPKKPPALSVKRDCFNEYEWAVTALIYVYIRTSSENMELRTHQKPEDQEPHNSFLVNYRGNDFRVSVTKV